MAPDAPKQTPSAEMAAGFLKRRAGASTGDGFSAVLNEIPDVEPEPRDALPADLQQGSIPR
jgi:hypothetical protein